MAMTVPACVGQVDSSQWVPETVPARLVELAAAYAPPVLEADMGVPESERGSLRLKRGAAAAINSMLRAPVERKK